MSHYAYDGQTLIREMRRSPNTGKAGAGKTGDGEIVAGMLKAALAVLSDPDVPGYEKRNALAPIVERMICREGGADVVFAPDFFDEPWGEGNDLWSKDGARQTHQTTCMVCQVRAGRCTFLVSGMAG